MILKYYFISILLLSASIYSQPKLEIERNIDAGRYLRGKEVSYEVRFRNTGNENLEITSLSTSCGCTGALLSDRILEPGQSGTIKFTFNGQGYGTVTKSLYINTNEPDNQQHTVNVTMHMVEPLSCSPQSIISEGKVGDEIIQKATITNTLDHSIEILEVTSNTPVIKIESDRNVIAGGGEASIDIKIKIYEESTINAAVIIRTTEGEIQIPVLVEVKSN
jgi:hypothetical protein